MSTSRRRLLARMAALVMLPSLAALSGCGRKGDLEPPPDRSAAYPRSYPKKASPKDEMAKDEMAKDVGPRKAPSEGTGGDITN